MTDAYNTHENDLSESLSTKHKCNNVLTEHAQACSYELKIVENFPTLSFISIATY